MPLDAAFDATGLCRVLAEIPLTSPPDVPCGTSDDDFEPLGLAELSYYRPRLSRVLIGTALILGGAVLATVIALVRQGS